MTRDEPPVPDDLRRRILHIDHLSQWERAELGRDLRRAGLSYGEIQRFIPAAKATLSRWCRGIELSDTQRAAIRARTGSREGIPVDTQWKRRLEVEQIRTEARGRLSTLLHDPFWSAGLLLYWGEGTKGGRRVAMTNSDPALLRFFMLWVRRYLDRGAGFKAAVTLHAINELETAQRWWSSQLAIPVEDFNKAHIKPDGSGQRKNHLNHGVCQLRLRRSANHLHTVISWIDAIREMNAPDETLSSLPGR